MDNETKNDIIQIYYFKYLYLKTYGIKNKNSNLKNTCKELENPLTKEKKESIINI